MFLLTKKETTRTEPNNDEDGEALTDDDQVDALRVLEASPLLRNRSVFANAVRPATTADTEDDEVVIVAEICRCPDCKAGKGCTKPEEEIPVPCPIRGGQKKTTQKAALPGACQGEPRAVRTLPASGEP